MNAPFGFRPVQAQDWQEWLPLWHGYNAFYGRVGAIALAEEITRTTGQRFLAEQARAGGAASLYWQTHETNATAMRLYDQVATKAGFLVYRRELG